MSALFEAMGLAGGYGDIEVVHDVSFSAEPGAITALMGRNGAGKTTSLRLAAGLNPLRRGTVTLDGLDLTTLRAHARVEAGLGYVQEGKRVFRDRSIDENLRLGAYSRRLSRRELAGRVEQAYSRFPALAARRSAHAGQLSGGQQQMLAIAQCLAGEPRVLLLDEPTTGLAPTIVDELFDLLQALRGEGLSVVLVEQALDFCLAVADSAVVVNLGRVVFAGRTDDPGVRTAAEAAYLGAELA